MNPKLTKTTNNTQRKLSPLIACRSCNSSNLSKILSLGNHGLSDFIEMSDQRKIPKYPLQLILCKNCNLLQMRHTTPPDQLYTDRYGYRSGINNTTKNNLIEITQEAEEIMKLKSGDIVVDIGCNDGTLLASYQTSNLVRVGFDPVTTFAKYFHKSLENKGIKKYKLFNNYFQSAPFLQYFKNKKAKIITAISMFYDLDDPNKFISNIKEILDPEGLLVIQQNYLIGMIQQCAFDNVVHEHLEYYSLDSLETLLEKHNLEVFDVTLTSINGGSFRTLIKFKNGRLKSSGGLERVKKIREMEKKLALGETKTYLSFASKVKKATTSLKKFIKREAKKGKIIYIYGASTRGNTLIQACGLDFRVIKAAAERNQEKWGKKIAATSIPIISEEQARIDHPDYFLVLPWFFKPEFLEREKEYLILGGKMIFPLPEPEVISLKNGKIEIKPI